MKQTKNEVEEVVTNTEANTIVSKSVKYPLGYARPNEREARLRFKENLKRLPKSIANINRSQKEAARNGLTEEILEKLLLEDAA